MRSAGFCVPGHTAFPPLPASPPSTQKRLNLTKTVRKQPITEALQRAGQAVEDRKHHDPKYDEEHPVRAREGHSAHTTAAAAADRPLAAGIALRKQPAFTLCVPRAAAAGGAA